MRLSPQPETASGARMSKKTCRLYIFCDNATMTRYCPEMRVKVLDQRQRAAACCSADEMR